MEKIFKIAIVIFVCFWMLKEIFLPVGAAAMYSFDFMESVIQCDTAMESNWYNTQHNDINIDKSDTIQLLACHEYDKTRKILLMSGLPEEYLSWLGLHALEIYQRPASEFVDQHKFQFK